MPKISGIPELVCGILISQIFFRKSKNNLRENEMSFSEKWFIIFGKIIFGNIFWKIEIVLKTKKTKIEKIKIEHIFERQNQLSGTRQRGMKRIWMICWMTYCRRERDCWPNKFRGGTRVTPGLVILLGGFGCLKPKRGEVKLFNVQSSPKFEPLPLPGNRSGTTLQGEQCL